jgi:hypothetical protein
MKRLGLYLVLVFASLNSFAGEKVLFSDCAKQNLYLNNYFENKNIEKILYNGGNFAIAENAIIFNSGVYAKATTVGTKVIEASEPCGQVYFRIGKKGNLAGSIVQFGLMDKDNVELIMLDIDPNGDLRLSGATPLGYKFSANKFANVVMNYDLNAKNYELIVDGKSLGKFAISSTAKTPARLFFGAMYWGAGSAGMLEEYQWKVSDQPFAGGEVKLSEVTSSEAKTTANGTVKTP